jgi:HD superfamily phosphohydrolase YqeK
MNIDKLGFYKAEVEDIKDERLARFAKLVLEAAPDYAFVDCPSSSSGKYHAADELGGDGCVVHTRRVVAVVKLLARGMNFEHTDAAIVAALVHDLRKQGVQKSGHTVADHGDLAAALVMEVAVHNPGVIEDEDFEMIYNAVGCHYGPWAVGSWKFENFYAEADLFSRLVHAADYIASRKEIAPRIKM